MDFGLSRVLNSEVSLTRGIGTSIYMSPELVLGDNYNEKVDIFAFGVLFWIVLTEQYHPYEDSGDNISYKVANNPYFRPNLKSINGNNCGIGSIEWIPKVIRSCWSHKSVNRPSFSKIIEILREKKSVETFENEEDILSDVSKVEKFNLSFEEERKNIVSRNKRLEKENEKQEKSLKQEMEEDGRVRKRLRKVLMIGSKSKSSKEITKELKTLNGYYNFI